MAGLTGWPRAVALDVAKALHEALAPACENLVIAGSLRRGEPTVGDVELLAISKIGGQGPTHYKLLDLEVDDLLARGVLDLRLNKRGHRIGYGPLNKYLVHQKSGVAVDLFTTTPGNFGMAYLVRTGPKEFNIRVMSRFRALGMKGHAYGGVSRGRETVACPDEETVFRLLGWPYLAPQQRQDLPR
jgi:DNA polymerase (family X)